MEILIKPFRHCNGVEEPTITHNRVKGVVHGPKLSHYVESRIEICSVKKWCHSLATAPHPADSDNDRNEEEDYINPGNDL